jgi:hypothetical protein
VFQERLYCIRWTKNITEINGLGQEVTKIVRRYAAPDEADIERELKVLSLLHNFFADWQCAGFIPSKAMPDGGEKTEEPIPTHEPTAADPVPLCGCGSMEGLHIVGITTGKTALLLCDTCRTARLNDIEVSVPIYLITTPTALERLLERDGLAPDDTVMAYRDLLSLNLVAKYRAKARPKGASVQNVLFPGPEEPQQSLL